MQLRAVFSLLGPGLRNGSRSVAAPGEATRSRGKRRAVKAAGLLAIGAMSTAAAPAMAGEVVITVTNLKSSDGVVRACLTADGKSFPKCDKDPKAKRVVVPANNTVTVRFIGVEAGNYAVALLHDENNNGKADRRLGMIPKEGYGFSRDAKVVMGPPSYKDAVFKHGSGTQRLTIKMRYW